MATRKGINISGTTPHPIYYMPCSYIMHFVFKKKLKVVKNRVLHSFKILTTIRDGVLISG